jgi:hypothetical protein
MINMKTIVWVLAAVLLMSIPVLMRHSKPNNDRVGNAPPSSPSLLGAYSHDQRESKVTEYLSTPKPLMSRAGENSKSTEFNDLAASKNPEERLAAYWMAAGCYETHQDLKNGFVPEIDRSKCGDIQEGQYDNAQLRVDLLRNTLGVHKNWLAIHSREGPYGMWRSIPAGPDYDELEKEAYKAALVTADPYALNSESGVLAERNDYVKAITMAVASMVSLAHDRGIQNYDPSKESRIAILKQQGNLSDEVVSQAIADGKQIVAKAPRSYP